MCELTCPPNFYQNEVTRKCVSTCLQDPLPTYYYENTTDTYCLQICPDTTLADPTTMSCITTLCPSNPALFAFNNTCISVCPATKYQHTILR